MEKLRDIVYNARRSAGWSQQALGEKIGVWGTYIGQIEKGTRLPSDDRILALAKTLHLDNEILLITAYYERADSRESRVLFEKFHRLMTAKEDSIKLSRLSKAQQSALKMLYEHWLNSDPSPIRATTISRLCSLTDEKRDTVSQLIKAFDT